MATVVTHNLVQSAGLRSPGWRGDVLDVFGDGSCVDLVNFDDGTFDAASGSAAFVDQKMAVLRPGGPNVESSYYAEATFPGDWSTPAGPVYRLPDALYRSDWAISFLVYVDTTLSEDGQSGFVIYSGDDYGTIAEPFDYFGINTGGMPAVFFWAGSNWVFNHGTPKWLHCVISQKNGLRKYYVNGVYLDEAEDLPTFDETKSYWVSGHSNPNLIKVDQIRFFNRALTDKEVLYLASVEGASPHPFTLREYLFKGETQILSVKESFTAPETFNLSESFEPYMIIEHHARQTFGSYTIEEYHARQTFAPYRIIVNNLKQTAAINRELFDLRESVRAPMRFYLRQYLFRGVGRRFTLRENIEGRRGRTLFNLVQSVEPDGVPAIIITRETI